MLAIVILIVLALEGPKTKKTISRIAWTVTIIVCALILVAGAAFVLTFNKSIGM